MKLKDMVPVDLGGLKRTIWCFHAAKNMVPFFLIQQERSESDLIFQNRDIFYFTAPGVSLLI